MEIHENYSNPNEETEATEMESTENTENTESETMQEDENQNNDDEIQMDEVEINLASENEDESGDGNGNGNGEVELGEIQQNLASQNQAQDEEEIPPLGTVLFMNPVSERGRNIYRGRFHNLIIVSRSANFDGWRAGWFKIVEFTKPIKRKNGMLVGYVVYVERIAPRDFYRGISVEEAEQVLLDKGFYVWKQEIKFYNGKSDVSGIHLLAINKENHILINGFSKYIQNFGNPEKQEKEKEKERESYTRSRRHTPFFHLEATIPGGKAGGFKKYEALEKNLGLSWRSPEYFKFDATKTRSKRFLADLFKLSKRQAYGMNFGFDYSVLDVPSFNEYIKSTKNFPKEFIDFVDENSER